MDTLRYIVLPFHIYFTLLSAIGDGLVLNYGNATGTVEAVTFKSNGGVSGNIKNVLVSANSGDLHFNAANRSNQIVAYRDGNVGIGTNVPSQLLDVYGSIQVYSDIRLYNGTSIRFHGNGVVGMNGSATTQTFGSTGGAVNTHFSVGGVTAAMMISSSNGHVGIGTLNPTDPLHIYNTGGTTINFDTNGASNWRVGATTTGGGYSTGNAFAWYCFDDSSYKMTIGTNGKVGIGSNTPVNKLDVAGNIGMDQYLYHNGDTDTYLQFLTDRVLLFAGNDEVLDYEEGANSLLQIANGGEADVTIHDTAFFLGGSQGSYDKKVGIGTTQPTADRLHVRSATHTDSGGVMVVESGETGVDSGDILMILDFSGDSSISSANDYINFQDSGGEVGSIHSEVTYGTFTGGHVSQRPSGSDFSNWKPGMIVKSTGKILATGSSMALAWPEVELTTTQKDKAVMGVWEDNIPSGSHKDKYLNRSLPRIHYNAVGEGLIRVTDTNGNIETGDYICSSARTGHGEKQDDDLMHNYTVAKATQPYNFASASNDSELGYKSVLIGCTYHCG